MNGENDWAAGGLLILIRGVLLWILIPVGAIAWVITLPWSRSGLGNFLGWLDNNLLAVFQLYILRAGFPRPAVRWVHFRDLRNVTHRIGVGELG